VRRPVVLLLLLLVLVSVVAGLYAFGRYVACPPPDWWDRMFLRSGNFGCVQR
jgi:hypothetical protein